MFKKVISLVAVSAFVFGTAFAQQGAHQFNNKSPEEVAKMKTERMTNRLELTDVQSEQVHGILLESATRKAEIQEQYPQLQQAKTEGKEFRKESRAKVHSILTEEQIAKQREIRQGSGHKMKKGQGRNGANMDYNIRLEQMKTDLDLTNQQVAELKEVFEEAKNRKLEMQAKYPELEEARIEMQKNRTDTDKQLEKVLTADQYEKWQQRGSKNGKKGMRKGK